MANGKSGRKKQSKVSEKQKNKLKSWLKTLLVVILFIIIAQVLDIPLSNETEENNSNTASTTVPGDTTEIKKEDINMEEALILTMIDVGQGDSFLLEQNGKVALIDCGTSAGGTEVVKYLKDKGITRINYLNGTHPHDDHEGGMSQILDNFEVDKIILPELNQKHATSAWYQKLWKQIKDGGYTYEYAVHGTAYDFGCATIKILGPIEQPKIEKNNYSTILKVSIGDMDIIMTGDAETSLEKDVLEVYGDELDAEILKAGHHGSDTSTSDEFLEAVSPEYVLIPVGFDNKHEHPIKSVMQKFEDAGIPVYRTDECGTVQLIITEDNVIFNCEPGDYLSGVELVEREGQQ